MDNILGADVAPRSKGQVGIGDGDRFGRGLRVEVVPKARCHGNQADIKFEYLTGGVGDELSVLSIVACRFEGERLIEKVDEP